MLRQLGRNEIPEKALLVTPSMSILDRTSITKRKRYGDKGSPWRKPLEGWTVVRLAPLAKTWYLTIETVCITQWIQTS